MKTIFDRIVGTYKQRKNLHEQIEAQVAMINLDKIALFQDLGNCFDLNPRLNRKFYTNEQYFQHLGQAQCFLLPNTLLKTAARERVEKEKAWLISQPEFIKEQRKLYEKLAEFYAVRGRPYDVDAEIEELLNPTTSRAYYVGDFMNAVDNTVNLKRSFASSAWLYGDGKQTLEVVTDLRHVPDYSHHFPNRPPRNGQGSKRKEEVTRTAIQGLPALTGC